MPQTESPAPGGSGDGAGHARRVVTAAEIAPAPDHNQDAASVPPFGSIRPRENGLFDFASDGDGLEALLLPVVGLEGELIDVVAWAFGRPEAFWRRSGDAVFLGEHEIERNRGEAVWLCENPAGWLKLSGRGLCVLDWSAPLFPILGALGAVMCETAALERRLRAALLLEVGARVRSAAA